MATRALAFVGALLLASSATEASVTTNWVGTITAASSAACYRKTHKTNLCPTGYSYDKIATCWAQCPLDYPVECGMECLPQNGDCTSEIITKVASVANVALNAATAGVFGDLKTASKAVADGVKCGASLHTAIVRVVNYASDLQKAHPKNTPDQTVYALSRVDFVVNVLPSVVTSCLGLASSEASSTKVSAVVTAILKQVVSKGLTIATGYKSFADFMKSVSLGSTTSGMSSSSVATLEKLINTGTTCGTQMQDAINQVVSQVMAMKKASASVSTAQIRQTISKSSLFLTDIPAITTACMNDNAIASYTQRDQVRKALLLIIDQVIDTGESNGKLLTALQYAESVSQMALDVISVFDTTGLASMFKTFIEPICGPTSFIGVVDNGNMTTALGLTTDGKAFAGSYGTWTKTGDGVVKITFVSSDKKDVTVVIHSGGDTVAKVNVKKGETVVWTSTVAALADKTLYLDRWRPNFLGISGSGGGSLVSWISRAASGGHVDLTAKINVS